MDTVLAKITGKGDFPTDMLRYDSCYPATEQDSYIIEQSFRKFSSWEVYVRKVSRNSKTTRKKSPLCDWTVGRWESFGARFQLVE